MTRAGRRSLAPYALAAALAVADSAGAQPEALQCAPDSLQVERLEGCKAAFNGMALLTWIYIRREPGEEQILQYADEARTYDSACFEHLSAAKPETVDLVETVSGTLFRHSGGVTEPFCSGFRLTGSLIVTAAHCGTGIPADDRVTFRLYGAPETDIEVDLANPVVRGDTSDDATDVMVVPMLGEAPPPPPASLFRAAPPAAVCESFQPILIAGHSQITWWLEVRKDLSRWQETVKIDRGAGCRLHQVPTTPSEEHCLAYQCQTLRGMSGAAIYGYDYATGERVVIGIHLRGGAISGEKSCGRSDSRNVGIRLPAEILALLDGEEGQR